MTLLEFLGTLITDNIKAIICSSDEKEICTIYTYGVDALDELYKEQYVVSWEVVDRLTVKVKIEEMVSA